MLLEILCLILYAHPALDKQRNDCICFCFIYLCLINHHFINDRFTDRLGTDFI